MKASDFITNEIKPKIATSPIGATQDTQWYQILRNAQQQFALMYNWRFWQTKATITITAGESALPTDYKAQTIQKETEKPHKIPALIDTTTEEERWTYVDLLDYPYYETTDKVWTIDFSNWKIYAKTNGTYEFFYNKAPALAVAAGTDILGFTTDTPFNAPLYDILADICINRAYLQRKEMDMATLWYRQAQSKAKTFFAKTRDIV